MQNRIPHEGKDGVVLGLETVEQQERLYGKLRRELEADVMDALEDERMFEICVNADDRNGGLDDDLQQRLAAGLLDGSHLVLHRLAVVLLNVAEVDDHVDLIGALGHGEGGLGGLDGRGVGAGGEAADGGDPEAVGRLQRQLVRTDAHGQDPQTTPSTKSENQKSEFIKALLYIHYGADVAEKPRSHVHDPNQSGRSRDGKIQKDFELHGLVKHLPSGKTLENWLKGIELDTQD